MSLKFNKTSVTIPFFVVGVAEYDLAAIIKAVQAAQKAQRS